MISNISNAESYFRHDEFQTNNNGFRQLLVNLTVNAREYEVMVSW